MRELRNVTYTHVRRLSEDSKDELMIPNEFDGPVAIETWNINGELKQKAVCVTSITNCILGFGRFKEDLRWENIYG